MFQLLPKHASSSIVPLKCFNIESYFNTEYQSHLSISSPSLTDARECILCGEDDWSNNAHDACVPKIIEFLAFGEPLGITLIVISAFGALVTIAVAVSSQAAIPNNAGQQEAVVYCFLSAPRWCSS